MISTKRLKAMEADLSALSFHVLTMRGLLIAQEIALGAFASRATPDQAQAVREQLGLLTATVEKAGQIEGSATMTDGALSQAKAILSHLPPQPGDANAAGEGPGAS